MRFFIVFTTLLLSTAIAFPVPGDGKSPVHDADVALRDINSEVRGSEGRTRHGRDITDDGDFEEDFEEDNDSLARRNGIMSIIKDGKINLTQRLEYHIQNIYN
ncbi:hypothetical protein GGU10DRAFT_370729 [Lentinula aff. detonsa]|uniref:RxLR effector protein n=1 Tax=Lentinula aff. detonsa TaxID=2804958 RepID=A0AA38NTH8_9AGAR|nr:hypothetical protein GGU10DRAFT_370729 [Lentinula aff. detonsa]